MGWAIVTTTGTLAPFLVTAGSWSTGTCSRSKAESGTASLPVGAAHARGIQTPTAAEANPRNSRLESPEGRDATCCQVVIERPSVSSGVELGLPIGPVDVSLEGLHGIGVRINP